MAIIFTLLILSQAIVLETFELLVEFYEVFNSFLLNLCLKFSVNIILFHAIDLGVVVFIAVFVVLVVEDFKYELLLRLILGLTASFLA